MLRFLGITREQHLPPDKLGVHNLVAGRAVFQAHSGIPDTADGLAYEPVQHLLAVRRATSAVAV